jgi:hypothetical protein
MDIFLVCASPVGCILQTVKRADLLESDARVAAFAERVCKDGWAADIAGGAPRTVLVPQRYWFHDPKRGRCRGSIVAASVTGTSVLMDVHLDGYVQSVDLSSIAWIAQSPRECAMEGAATAMWQRPVPAGDFAAHLLKHGALIDVPSHTAGYYPPRRVVASVSGESVPGWLVGWDPASAVGVIAAGLYPDPGVGCAATLAADLSSGTAFLVPEADISPRNAVEAAKKFLLDAAACGGSTMHGQRVVVGGPGDRLRVPAPLSTTMPGAHFEHIQVDGQPWSFAILAPNDIGLLFASRVMQRGMREAHPEQWDISAVMPCMTHCKRLRDALPGMQSLLVCCLYRSCA